MSPASVELPDPHGSYLVLNCSYLPEYVDDPSNMITLISHPQMFKVDSIITKNLFDGLFTILNDSPYDGLKNAEYLEMRTSDTTGFMQPISPYTVTKLCTDKNVQYLVSLEYYTFYHTYDYYVDAEYNYYGFLLHKHDILWRIYSHSGQVIDAYILRDSFYSDQLELDYYEKENGLFYNNDLISDAFWEAGIEYGERISPSWEYVYRYIYEIRENTDSGKIRITENIDRLRYISSSGNKLRAYMACFNLAVLSESQDNIDNALKWLELAINNKKTILALKYRSILKERLQVRNQLDKQSSKTK